MLRLTSHPKALALSFLKRVGRRQFPDLGVELLHLLLVNRRLLAAPALEHAGHTFEQGPLPLMDHRRMHPEPARQPGLGLRRVCVPFDISDLLLAENQETANRSLC